MHARGGGGGRVLYASVVGCEFLCRCSLRFRFGVRPCASAHSGLRKRKGARCAMWHAQCAASDVFVMQILYLEYTVVPSGDFLIQICAYIPLEFAGGGVRVYPHFFAGGGPLLPHIWPPAYLKRWVQQCICIFVHLCTLNEVIAISEHLMKFVVFR